jgi:hypothetical protein
MLSVFNLPATHSKHDPNSRDVLRELHNLNPKRMPCLVTLCQKDFLACLIRVNVLHHPICVEVCELNWECFERVALRHVVFDTHLEFLLRIATASNAFKFVICNCS